MANIRVDSSVTITDGLALTFRSPVDISQVTGLKVYYPESNATASKVFQFADAHGQNIGDLNLFASNVIVKVILDTASLLAYVQNADTNAYLEGELAKKYSPDNKPTAADVGASPIGHTHDDKYYTEGEVNNLLASKQDSSTAINTGNIGSQSVNYANSSGWAGGSNSSNYAAITDPATASLKNINAGATDIGAGASLATGQLYFVYE